MKIHCCYMMYKLMIVWLIFFFSFYIWFLRKRQRLSKLQARPGTRQWSQIATTRNLTTSQSGLVSHSNFALCLAWFQTSILLIFLVLVYSIMEILILWVRLGGRGMVGIIDRPLAFHFPFYSLSWLRWVKVLVETELKLQVACLCFMVWTSGLCYNPATSCFQIYYVLIFLCLHVVDGQYFVEIHCVWNLYCFSILCVMFVLKPYGLNACAWIQSIELNHRLRLFYEEELIFYWGCWSSMPICLQYVT